MKWLAMIASFAMALSSVDADLECALGWGKGTHTVSEEKINDGYCDCPLDGADEPRTSACSGSAIGSFAGIPAVSQESKKYQCPQQKSLQIPYSRFNDGICDCCDGSDELPTVCPDICDQVLAEERALREKLSREFSVGYDLREREIAEFQKLLKEKEIEKQQKDKKIEEVKEQLSEVEAELNHAKHEFMQERVTRVEKVAKQVALRLADQENLTGLLDPLSNDEIINLIIHSCQMAGEMDRAAGLEDSTCVPLRLAGLDSALLWGHEKDGKADLKRIHLNVREEGQLLADMLLHNVEVGNDRDKDIYADGGRASFNKRNRRKRNKEAGRRRLQAVSSSDDEYRDEYMDDEYDYEYAETEEEEPSDSTNNGDEEVGVEDRILDSIKDSLFSQSRVAFLRRADEIIQGVQDLLKEDEKEETGEEGDAEDAGKSGQTDNQKKQEIDVAAYNMVKSTLEDRGEAIERGYDWAISSKILLAALTETTPDSALIRDDLLKLAIGTISFGKLSLAHVWHIFQAVVEELKPDADQATVDEKTCATSLWVAACPPRSIVRDNVSFPPRLVIEAAQKLCTTPTFTKENAEACAADADNELPTVMPNGYYGYETVQARDDSDPLQKVQDEWDAPIEEALKSKLDDLEKKKGDVEKQVRDMEKSVREITELLSGAGDGNYSIDGEIYALKDKCFSVKAGKYTYELCIFGSSAQKEGDAKHGTGLGQWLGVEHDESTGERVFKWNGGIKCWNGPQRSATAYVTCGAETKVLSADEPDTCRYVMKMESHIACDDAFRKLHEL